MHFTHDNSPDLNSDFLASTFPRRLRLSSFLWSHTHTRTSTRVHTAYTIGCGCSCHLLLPAHARLGKWIWTITEYKKLSWCW